MKKTTTPRRIIIILVVLSVMLLGLDLVTHHHAEVEFLPHFGLYLLISIGAGLMFIAGARALAPLLCRKEDYYDR